MAKEKIRAILEEPPHEPGIGVEELLDSLAQRIFLPELDEETLIDYYIPRTKLINKRYDLHSSMDVWEKADIYFKDVPSKKIGPFEKLLWNKLVHPPRNVILLVGGVGCGKTMSAQLIAKITENNPKHCDESLHDSKFPCNKKRLHIMMDFNEVDYMHEEDYDRARQEFVKDLADRLSANLYGTLNPTDTIEFIDFWNYEISRQRKERNIEFAFSRIMNEMHRRVGPNWQKIVDEASLEKRKEVFEEIKRSANLFLDYQCRFWRYVMETIYRNKRHCVFAILDNIDCASPVLQAAVRNVIVSHQKRFNNTFFVCLRPETLMATPGGAAANLVDIEPHCGPEPFDVIIDRLKRFVDSPESFFRAEELDGELETYAQWLGGEILRYLVNRNNRRIIRPFVECLAGNNIRNTLVMATNLMKLKIEEGYTIRPHQVNRMLISLPDDHYSRNPLSPVENIFHVEGSPKGRLLVKPRVLRLMRLGQQNKKSISDIITTLAYFGYGPELICRACNEMMEPAHQLIISNGRTQYSTVDFVSSENDMISLTYTGIGYADKLIHNLDYMQMVMPDCVVESSNFSVVSRHPLFRLLKTVIAFLNELIRFDRMEMKELKTISDIDVYFSSFGATTLTWRIVRNICTSIWRVLLFLERNHREYLNKGELRAQMLDVYLDVANIMNIAAHRNQEALRKEVNYIIPKPLDEKLRTELESILNRP